jgi:protease IV
MLKKFWRFLVRSFAILGFFSFLSTLALILFAITFQPPKPTVPDKAVLMLDFRNGVTETPDGDPLRAFLKPDTLDLLTLTEAIHTAASDNRIKGLVADLSFADVSLSHVQEIRQAVLEFRKSGKFTVAFTDTFSEGGGSLGSYYLASAFEDIWMQPSGMIMLTGIAAEVPFARAALDRIGILPEFVQRQQYKDAMDSLTRSDMSTEQRQALESLLGSLYQTVADDLGADRKLTQPAADILKNGPYLAEDAKALNLVDHLGYVDQLRASVLERMYGKEDAARILKQKQKADHTSLSVAEYNTLVQGNRNTEALAKQAAVGVIYLDGTIMRSDEDTALAGNGGVVSPLPILKAFDEAIKSKRIKAIVLRINSPGGSYVASDTMRRAVVRAREAGKPVFVSMGPLAASGGYFIGMEGQQIFATPASLVGSIGVFGGKLVLQDLFKTLSINWEHVAIGDRSLMWSSNVPFSDTSRAAFARTLDFVFDDFSGKARAVRKLREEQWPGLVGGRVLTGTDGVTAGLVDKTGTLRDTIAAARAAVNLPGTSTTLIVYPKQQTPLEMIREALENGNLLEAMQVMIHTVRMQSVLVSLLNPLLPPQTLEMPGVTLRY